MSFEVTSVKGTSTQGASILLVMRGSASGKVVSGARSGMEGHGGGVVPLQKGDVMLVAAGAEVVVMGGEGGLECYVASCNEAAL